MLLNISFSSERSPVVSGLVFHHVQAFLGERNDYII